MDIRSRQVISHHPGQGDTASDTGRVNERSHNDILVSPWPVLKVKSYKILVTDKESSGPGGSRNGMEWC